MRTAPRDQYMRVVRSIEHKDFPEVLRFVERMFKVCTKSLLIMKAFKRYEADNRLTIDSMFFSFFLFSP